MDKVKDTKGNYSLVTDMAVKLNELKSYEVGYSNPGKGRMIINYKGSNYLVEIKPIDTAGEPTLENAMKEYGYIFR